MDSHGDRDTDDTDDLPPDEPDHQSPRAGAANLGETDLYISAKNLTIRPATNGGSMHLAADNIVIDAGRGVTGCGRRVLDTSVHATGNFDITADSIGAQHGSAHPLVHGTADALGTIEHEIDAHDMDWGTIRVSSLEVNARINAINDGQPNRLHRPMRRPRPISI